MEAQGQLYVELNLGEKTFEYRVVAASIAEETILGLDFMKEHVIKLDLKVEIMYIKDHCRTGLHSSQERCRSICCTYGRIGATRVHGGHQRGPCDR